jgi:hypothetical protein
MEIVEGERQQQQQQQQQPPPPYIHRSVLDGIARLSHPYYYREERHRLIVDGWARPPIDRRSLEHLVNFLDKERDNSHEVRISELELDGIPLSSEPSDGGGLNVLIDFFSRFDTTLTKVALRCTENEQCSPLVPLLRDCCCQFVGPLQSPPRDYIQDALF